MGLTDDPFYRNMTEGEDTHILVGTLTTRMRAPSNARVEVLPVFLVDYHPAKDDMEKVIAATFDDLKKINTTLIFSGGETAAHTAPNFWAQYTPLAEEHEAFQKEYRRTGVWVLMLITKIFLREFLIIPSGDVIYRNIIPLSPELKRMLKIQE
jgi:hypothetical protein